MRHDLQAIGIDDEQLPPGPIGDVKLRPVAAQHEIIGSALKVGGLEGAAFLEADDGQRRLVDVERIEEVLFRIQEKAALEVLLFAIITVSSLVRDSLPSLRSKMCNMVGAAAGPPHAILRRRRRQAEPALPHRLLIDDLRFGEIDERQFVFVVAAGGDEGVFVVGQRNDVERQVREDDVFAGRREHPAVGQQEAFFGRAGELRFRFVLGNGSDSKRTAQQHGQHSETMAHERLQNRGRGDEEHCPTARPYVQRKNDEDGGYGFGRPRSWSYQMK